MKDKFKKLLFISLAFALSAFIVTGCSASGASDEAELSETDTLMLTGLDELSRGLVTSLDTIDDEELDEFLVQAEDMGEQALVNGYTTWKSTRDDLGKLKSINTVETEKTGSKAYRAVVDATYEKRDCEITVGISRSAEAGQTIVAIDELSFSPVYSVGELMAQAFTNMVVGMGTVFAVLIFIALIIGLFRYLPNPEAKAAEKAKESAVQEAAETALELSASSRDDEICAVIAAAIAAYEAETGTKRPSGGLIVRSIKRVPNVIKRK